ncbi:hypothetical protein R1flu_015537 [Riccia fluitans]|uniref:RING-type domain-containing protein n=1 Tax=Riccia fluitans TaxID=41844 RepID=A0ABD1YJ94_9MARC
METDDGKQAGAPVDGAMMDENKKVRVKALRLPRARELVGRSQVDLAVKERATTVDCVAERFADLVIMRNSIVVALNFDYVTEPVKVAALYITRISYSDRASGGQISSCTPCSSSVLKAPQEGSNRKEIEALVEQQRLQRLERQRCEEDTARLVRDSSSHSDRSGDVVHGRTANDVKGSGNTSKGSKQQQYEFHDCRDRQCASHCIHGDIKNKKTKDSSFAAAAANCAAADVSRAGSTRTGGVWSGKESQRSKHAQQQQQSIHAVVESRRRLARGPRSGAPVVSDAHVTVPLEDHRVVSTEYQASGTQALMRVTLLAAGFVIGARGISARLIGQVTGSIVQSWTESSRPDAVPIRLFRIQGKKAVVQAAVVLISQAVVKYKDLCDCKRRGEFVQREHVINGVEFYYQPPPRKAFAVIPESSLCSSGGNLVNNQVGGNSKQGSGAGPDPSQGVGVPNDGGSDQLLRPAPVIHGQLSFPLHQVWLQYFQAQQQQKQLQQQEAQQLQKTAHRKAAVKSGVVPVVDDNQSMVKRVTQPQGFFDWRQQQHNSQVQQQQAIPQPKVLGQQQQKKIEHLEENVGCDSNGCSRELERIDQGLQQSVVSLEQALQQVRLEQRLLQQQNNREVAEPAGACDRSVAAATNSIKQMKEPNVWAESKQERGGSPGQKFHQGSSLFSIFGTSELPLPVSRDGRSDTYANSAAAAVPLGMLNSSASSCTTPFDFLQCDFLRESLHSSPFTSHDNGPVFEYNRYGHTQNDPVDTNLCVVCLERPVSVRLMACGHSSFCLDCLQGLADCPLCHEKIVGMHQCPPTGPTASPQCCLPVAAKLNGFSYHLWNWIPGASV